MTKTCKKCGEEKELELFAKGTKYQGGRRNTCKKCHAEYMAQYMKDNPDKYAKQLKHNSKTRPSWKRHRITEEAYKALLALHDGNCHGCQERQATNIDHDHKCCDKQFSCGKCVRGILCNQCNTALGLLGDNIQVLQRVIAYIS